jgi:hypothetical protein
MAIMAITTSSSISVKPVFPRPRLISLPSTVVAFREVACPDRARIDAVDYYLYQQSSICIQGTVSEQVRMWAASVIGVSRRYRQTPNATSVKTSTTSFYVETDPPTKGPEDAN